MIDIVLIIGSIISFVYLIIILGLTIGVKKFKSFTGFETNQFDSFSIVVPFRNEAENLETLLKSFENIDYPFSNFEIILVNDGSTDASEMIVQEFIEQHPEMTITLLQQNKVIISPKKEAIEKALIISKHEWIITTDADCKVPINWLAEFNKLLFSTHCDMVVAPVIFSSNQSFLEDFQQLDFMSLMAATQGGFGIGYPFLCNGANLCYKKSVFKKVKGFEGNLSIASGDDIFLMEKFLNQNKASVKYLKSNGVIVETKPQKTKADFINQRIRWAAKTIAYENKTGKFVGIVVLSINLWLFLSFFLLFIKWISISSFLLFWLMKLSADYLLLHQITLFYKTKIVLKKYLIFSFIYPFYSVLIGFLSLKKGYQWKGRKFLR